MYWLLLLGFLAVVELPIILSIVNLDLSGSAIAGLIVMGLVMLVVFVKWTWNHPLIRKPPF
jgi:hypothetical protein